MGQSDNEEQLEQDEGFAFSQTVAGKRKKLRNLARLRTILLKKWQFLEAPEPYRPWRGFGKEFVQTLIGLLKVDARLTEDIKLLAHRLSLVVTTDEVGFPIENWLPNYVTMKILSCACVACSNVSDVDVITN